MIGSFHVTNRGKKEDDWRRLIGKKAAKNREYFPNQEKNKLFDSKKSELQIQLKK